MPVSDPRRRAITLAVMATLLFSTGEISAKALAAPELGGVSGLTLGALRALTGGAALLVMAALTGSLHLRLDALAALRLIPFGAAAGGASFFAAYGAQNAGVAPTALMFVSSALVVVAIRALQSWRSHGALGWTRADSLGALGCVAGAAIFAQVWSGARSLSDFAPGLAGAVCWAIWPTMSANFRRQIGDRAGFAALGAAQLTGGGLLVLIAVTQAAATNAPLALPRGPLAWALVLLLGVGVTGYATKMVTDLLAITRETRDRAGRVRIDPLGLRWQMLTFVRAPLAALAAAALFAEDFLVWPKIAGSLLIVTALLYARWPRGAP